jgi:hypothetical protein
VALGFAEAQHHTSCPMGARSTHERWRRRDEPVHHRGGCECTVTSSVGTAARGPISAGALYWKRCDLGRLESLLRLFC